MSKVERFPTATILCLFAQSLVFAGDNPADSWEILTGDTKLRFVLRDGRPVISDLRAVNYANCSSVYNWAAEREEVEPPKTVEISGNEQNIEFKHVGATASKWRIRFTYHSSSLRLELVSTWESTDGPGPVEHTVVLNNRSDKVVTFSPTSTIALAARPDRAKELWWVEQTEATPSDIGVHVEDIGQDCTKSLRTGPNISPKGGQGDAIPWFCLQDTAAKEGLYGGIEFSGFTEILLEKTSGGNLYVGLGLDRRDGETRSRIEPGGTFRYPTSFIGTYRGEVDDGCNRLHRWVEGHLRPPVSGPVPMLCNNTWSPREIRFDINEAKARTMIDVCHDLGIELFEVDAGWYTTAGDWNVDTKKFPNGMRRLSEYARSKGIKFGLWIAWAHGTPHLDGGRNVLSPFNPVQKSWFTRDYPANWRRPVPWEGAPVCLGCPRAREWCLDLLRHVITDYQLDVLRQDQICVVENCVREGHDHIPNDPVDVSRAAARGYYEIYGRLKSEFPHLLFEGCNGGGRMADFGFLKRVHYYQLEDSYVPINTRRAFYDASFPFPPIMLLQWIRAGPAEETRANFKYRLRSAMLGWCSIQMDITRWSDMQRKTAEREFAVYKKRLRSLVASADLYHVLPRPDGKHWDGIQYFDPKSGQGALIVFRPESDMATQRVHLRGFSEKKFYSVTATDGSIENGKRTGQELMESGLNVTLPEQNSSDIIFFAEVDIR
ncbi:MAG: alpha-galactosidase [Planctomycetota bacterium]|jgi:hypothetical protein